MIRFPAAVLVTSTTTGTGTFTLGGAVTGYRDAAASGLPSGARVCYTCEEGNSREVGIGILTSGASWTLSRDTILFSTNSNNRVNWAAGTRRVGITVTEESFRSRSTEVRLSANQNISNAVDVALSWGTTIRDQLGAVGGDARFLTVPVGVSRVRLTAGVQWAANNTGQRRVSIVRVSGDVVVASDARVAAASSDVTLSREWDVSSGDAFLVYANQSSGGTLAVQAEANTWFAMESIA